ncbi:hypothetical protein LIER_41606 [Lithospermum erythrorhizon]|uniref:Uncharacterized protein n=1 Tax=Lithospermum erythrorhizon TaxID=34254 RepID=A0AAV3REU1_LITER
MELTEGIKMMNPSTTILEEILLQEKRSGDNSDIRFVDKGYKMNQKTPVRTWVAAGTIPIKFRWTCYHCKKREHITPYCYKIHGRGRSKFSQPKVQWRKSKVILCLLEGEKGRIVGKGKMSVEGLLALEGVLLVEGLTANVISVSQLCDNGMKVAFSKESCCVNNSSNEVVMKEPDRLTTAIFGHLTKT